jgi:hypothetical protein
MPWALALNFRAMVNVGKGLNFCAPIIRVFLNSGLSWWPADSKIPNLLFGLSVDYVHPFEVRVFVFKELKHFNQVAGTVGYRSVSFRSRAV